MANTPFFWKLISRNYIASPVANEEIYQEKLERTRRALRPDWSMIEIGCGSGNTALTHAPYVNHITAYDFCGPMLEHGRTRAANEGIENVEFVEASLDDIDTKTSFDAVLMLSVIHLIPDWTSAIRKAAQLTRPSGIFVSSTVTIDTMPTKMRAVLSLVNLLPVLPTVARISRAALVAEIEKNGLIVEENWQPEGHDSVFIIARKPT
ncbi:class I SAM-dependent methyltransferase [Celeribacter sp.]|uniref:class I SAM-dependent methyltransferase n=1 Tax=Celeribacter sp. TaxID=1890673 RepID=UPI003A8E9269